MTPPSFGDTEATPRVCVVGAGPRFLSGISYYTNNLIRALGANYDVYGLLVRQLVPKRAYPGRERVGKKIADFEATPDIDTRQLLDWYWGPRLLTAIWLLCRRRPDVLILQWWTGALLHTYLLLAFVARRLGVKVIIEFHEVQDVGELALPFVGSYVDTLMPALVRMTDAAVIHSEADRAPILDRYRLAERPLAVISHGPYSHHTISNWPTPQAEAARPLSLLYFGTIRPFKGVEDLVSAFGLLTDEQAENFSLTVAGETWEQWVLPGQLIAKHRHRDKIEFINRYLTDEELAFQLGRADVIVLPYHRSSASGPLHIAMSAGLPVIVTNVGGLPEAAREYEGAFFVPARDPHAIAAAFERAREVRGQRYRDPHSWDATVQGFANLFIELESQSRVTTSRKGLSS